MNLLLTKKVVTQKDSARIQLVSKNIQLGSAQLSSVPKAYQLGSARKNPARLSSAQLANFQLEYITTSYLRNTLDHLTQDFLIYLRHTIAAVVTIVKIYMIQRQYKGIKFDS